MNNSQEIVIDEWDIKLDNKIVELKTCSDCDKFFDCELRKKYVIAVYESMNKGAGGGFEF